MGWRVRQKIEKKREDTQVLIYGKTCQFMPSVYPHPYPPPQAMEGNKTKDEGFYECSTDHVEISRFD